MVQGGPSKDTTPKAFCSGGVDSGKAVAESALATLLSFTAYLRPSEVLGLRGNDVVGPTKAHPHIAKNEWKFQRWDFQMNLPSWTRQSCHGSTTPSKSSVEKGDQTTCSTWTIPLGEEGGRMHWPASIFQETTPRCTNTAVLLTTDFTGYAAPWRSR